MQGYDPSYMTKTTGSNNEGLHTSKCHFFCNSSENTEANTSVLVFELSHISCLAFCVSSSPSFPPQNFPTSSRQTLAVNCEKFQLQKYKVNNCWESFIQISPLTGLSLSSSQGPTLEKAFSFSSASLGIRWISAFLFACYLNCDYYLLCA